MGSRLAPRLHQVRASTLGQLEERFGQWLPAALFPKAAAGLNSRNRIYTRGRTFWAWIWQGFNPKSSGREVVRQIQALFDLHDGPSVAADDGAYCRARARLPKDKFPRALAATATAADQLAPAVTFLQGRTVKLADGTTTRLADTPKNRRRYPALHTPKPNFPLMRVMVLFSLLSGAILHVVVGNLHVAELPMLYQMFDQLVSRDILLADRGFGNFVLLALLQHLKPKVDFIGRSARHVDGRRRLKRLGRHDWLVRWKAGSPSPWLPASLWAALPKQITVRIVQGSCSVKGFRVRRVTLVTTLLDPQLYSAHEILQAYLRRWRLEMCLDDLKTTLQMESLRARTPQMLEKELFIHLIVHNLIRCIMAQAASQSTVPLERISFKGTLDALRQFTHAVSLARSPKKRRQLWAKLLNTLATDLLPERPGRGEPRAVKRVKNKYDRLKEPRHSFKNRPKRNRRRSMAAKCNRALK